MFKKFLSLIAIVGLVSVTFGFMNPKITVAAGLTSMSDTVTNLTASAVANHSILFTTPTGVAAGQTIVLTFNNGTNTTGVLYSDMTMKDGASSLTLGATPAGATWGVSNPSPAITITSGTGTIAAGHVITITIGGTHQITNGAAGTTTLTINGSFGDSGIISMAIVSNGVVSIAAQVLATLSFTISQNALYFGNLATGNSCFAQNTNPGFVTCPTQSEAEAFNMTAGTNAPTGYTITVQGPTLTYGANTITALATNTASAPGTPQFGLRIIPSGGSGTVSAPYAAAGFAYTGTGSPVAVASASAPSATTTYSVRYLANISSSTPAGSYTAAHTYVATGNF